MYVCIRDRIMRARTYMYVCTCVCTLIYAIEECDISLTCRHSHGPHEPRCTRFSGLTGRARRTRQSRLSVLARHPCHVTCASHVLNSRRSGKSRYWVTVYVQVTLLGHGVCVQVTLLGHDVCASHVIESRCICKSRY